MKPADFLLYLFGNRGAIERIAGCRGALLVGAALVLSAGIARNWDAVYLLHDPKWVYGPFGMSLLSATFLYVVVFFRLGNAPKLSEYGAFLRLFWMTAPCAWLYAIPVEQWANPLTAAKWNVGFLVVVSLWRVALITRALSVLTQVPVLRVLVLLLPPAAFEMFVGGAAKMIENIPIGMGGVRYLSPEDAFVNAATGVIMGVSFWTFVGVGGASWFVLKDRRPLRPLSRDPLPFPTAALATAAACLAIGAAASTPMQRRFANEETFHQLVLTDRYDDAVRFVVVRPRDAFPKNPLRPKKNETSITGYDFYIRDTAALLRRLPPDAPSWLRTDWEDVLIEDLTASRQHLESRLEEIGPDQTRILAALRAQADAYRAHKARLSEEEKDWLREFDAATKAKPAGKAQGLKPSDPPKQPSASGR